MLGIVSNIQTNRTLARLVSVRLESGGSRLSWAAAGSYVFFSLSSILHSQTTLTQILPKSVIRAYPDRICKIIKLSYSMGLLSKTIVNQSKFCFLVAYWVI